MLKPIWNRIRGLRRISVILFSVTLSLAATNWKSLNHKICYQKKWPHEKAARKKNLHPCYIHEKKIRTTNKPREKVSRPWNLLEKEFWTYGIPMRINFDPQNIQEKNFLTSKYPQRHHETRPARTRGPTKFVLQKIVSWKLNSSKEKSLTLV